jgi:hypothetical protein
MLAGREQLRNQISKAYFALVLSLAVVGSGTAAAAAMLAMAMEPAAVGTTSLSCSGRCPSVSLQTPE